MRLNNFPIIKDRRLKVGVVGCGRISNNHFGSILHYSEELELAAVCDINGDVLKQAAAEYNVQGYTELRRYAHSRNTRLGCACTPSGLHPSQAILALSMACTLYQRNPGNPLQRWLENGSGMR